MFEPGLLQPLAQTRPDEWKERALAVQRGKSTGFEVLGRIGLPAGLHAFIVRTADPERRELHVVVFDASGAFVSEEHVGQEKQTNNADGVHTRVTHGVLADGVFWESQTVDLLRGAVYLEQQDPSLRRVKPDGSFASSQARLVGRYEDEKSHEVLLLAVEEKCAPAECARLVSYRAGPKKPLQRLAVKAAEAARREIVVSFRGSPKAWVLTLAADEASLTCKNPDGTVQTFVKQSQESVEF